MGAALLCVLSPVSACDVCGCSGAGSSPGLLPLVQRHFVGTRWQWQDYGISAHHPGGLIEETYQTVDLWGRWQPHRRIQVIGVIPYSSAARITPGSPTLRAEGVGDATVLLQYSLFDPVRQSARTWQHALQAGAGAKLPLGRSGLIDGEGLALPPNLQPGTGSTDYLAALLYAVRRGMTGISLDVTARLSTANVAGYRFGNRLNTGIQGFYVMSFGKTTFIPSAGLLVDARQEDREKTRIRGDTGGYALSAVLSLQFFRGNMAFNLNGGLPVFNQMGNGLIRPRFQLGAGAVYMISAGKKQMPQGIFKDVGHSSVSANN